MANRAETTITLTDAPQDDELGVIAEGLRGYNEVQAGYSDSRVLAVLVREAGVGDAGDPRAAELGEGAHMVGHQVGAGRTVQADVEEVARQNRIAYVECRSSLGALWEWLDQASKAATAPAN